LTWANPDYEYGSNYAYSEKEEGKGTPLSRVLRGRNLSPDEIEGIVRCDRDYRDWEGQDIVDYFELEFFKLPEYFKEKVAEISRKTPEIDRGMER